MSGNQAALGVLLRASLVETPDQTATTIDVFMFLVQFKKDADKDMFLTVLRAFLEPGGGVFRDMTPEWLQQGPSYIEMGGWLGDQRDALLFMALGEHHGVWKVVTPMTLGFARDSEEARQLAGAGLVLTTGFDPAVL